MTLYTPREALLALQSSSSDPLSRFEDQNTDLWATLIWKVVFEDRDCYLHLIVQREIKKQIFFMVHVAPIPPLFRRPYFLADLLHDSMANIQYVPPLSPLYLCPGSREPYQYKETPDSAPIEATLCNCPIMHDAKRGTPGRLYRSIGMGLDPRYSCKHCAVHYDFCWMCRDAIQNPPVSPSKEREAKKKGTPPPRPSLVEIPRIMACMFCGKTCQYLGRDLEPRPLYTASAGTMSDLFNMLDTFKRDREY